MGSLTTIFIFLSFAIVVSSAPHRRVNPRLMENYVLMPIHFADKILDKDIEKVENVRKKSYSLLKDLQENKEKYPPKVVSRTFARVLEEGAEALGVSINDLHRLIYPNGLA